ncbi:MAG: hypothetical protein EHM64_12405 [Ignavibacteriae bacterium]|nr:MAG: hypothetical protein EHM64_12405 [Ignavibacteriota bacterium]
MSVERTVRNETKAVALKLSDLKNGEYLLYKLKVWGPQGMFSIVDEKSRIILKQTDYFSPEHVYTRKWPKDPEDIPAEKDIIYTLMVSFRKAAKYSYDVELYRPDRLLPVTLKSIDFESTNARDSDYNTLRVLLT